MTLPSWLRNPFRRAVPLEEQLSNLAAVGIRLRDGVTTADLLRRFPEEFYRADPYQRLLLVMGEEFSDDILMLDTKRVTGNGSYVRVLQPMIEMTHGALRITALEDSVEDPDDAYVSFRLRGRSVQWGVILNGAWIDPTILAQMADLLDQQESDLHYFFHQSGGQTALIACCSDETLPKLNELTGMTFKLLRPR